MRPPRRPPAPPHRAALAPVPRAGSRADMAVHADRPAEADVAVVVRVGEIAAMAEARGRPPSSRLDPRRPPAPVVRPGRPPRSPAGYLSGRVDLVYRDPDTEEIVVADFKTDELPDGEACRQRAETYRPQAELYGRALQEGLALEAPPRLELWFLARDVTLRL